MKSRKIFLSLPVLIMMLPISLHIHSEDSHAGPVHPLMPEYYSYLSSVRIDADSIYYKEINYNGVADNSGYQTYRRSADGLKDTIFTASGLRACWVNEYSPDGRLISSKELVPAHPSRLWIEWQTIYNEYDSKGRIILTDIYDIDKNLMVSRRYNYAGNSVIPATVVFTEEGDLSVKYFGIRNTADGYIFEQITERIDPVRNTVIGKDTTEKEYVFDSENRLIRTANAVYTYMENGGYIETLSYRTGYYNRQGYPEKFYTYDDGKLVQTTEITYFSNNASPQTQNPSPADDAVTGERVYGTQDAVVVQSANPVTVTIYSIEGKLIKKTYINEEHGYIRLAGGFYIVKTEKTSYKVFVGK